MVASLSALAVALAWRAGPLTHRDAAFAATVRAGHRLAAELLVLAIVAAVVPALMRLLERRVRVGVTARRVLAAAFVVAAVGGLAAGVARGGGPASLATRAYHSFADPVPPREQGSLTTRLASLNGNGRARMWSVAIDSLHGSRWAIGSGAGSFERNWDRSKRADEVVRDAHGLYVEMLSELGVIGLLLLLAVLAIPLAAGLRRRAAALVPPLMGTYAAFVAHLAVDWDWELSGLALTGLFVGCLLLVAHRDDQEKVLGTRLRAGGVVAGVAAAAFVFVGLVGNTSLARAQAANGKHRFDAAAAAASTARRWMPWSPVPLQAQGMARLGQGDPAAARASFRAAIALDPDSWQSWLDLAATQHGRQRRRAVARARTLYPHNPKLVEFEEEASR